MSFGYEESADFRETVWVKRDHDRDTIDMDNNFINSQNYPSPNYSSLDQLRNNRTFGSSQNTPFGSAVANHVGMRIPVPSSSPVLSVDERLEKKRERNRIAATRCRQRKLHKIQTLEVEVKRLSDECNSLTKTIEQLRKANENLLGEFEYHRQNGCNISNISFNGPEISSDILGLPAFLNDSESPSPVRFSPE